MMPFLFTVRSKMFNASILFLMSVEPVFSMKVSSFPVDAAR